MSSPVSDKGFTPEVLKYLPSGFKSYGFNKLTVRDLSIGQTTSLSLLPENASLTRIREIYAPCFIDLTSKQVGELLFIDFITVAHFINHLSFGVYSSSFHYACDCPVCKGKKHKISYDLYDLEFDKPQKDYRFVVEEQKPFKVSLNPFTVSCMEPIVENQLEGDNVAFIASSINRMFINGSEVIVPEDFLERVEWLGTFPQKALELVSKSVLERYPSVKPLTASLVCGESVKFIPDLTLKGLPSFTNVSRN